MTPENDDNSATYERVALDPGFRELLKIARHRSLPRNHVVIAEGGKPGNLYLILSGLVTVRQSGRQGEELLLNYLYPGNFFGEMCLFPGVATRSAMVRTAADSDVLEIPYQPFVDLAQKYPSLWLELAGQLAARLRAVNQRLAEMPVLHAAERVWLVITDMASRIDTRKVPEGKCFSITRQDLAKLAGCSRELAGMILRDFAREGRIILRGKTIVIPPAPAAEAT